MNAHQGTPSRLLPPQITPPPLFRRAKDTCDGIHGCAQGSCFTIDSASDNNDYIGCCTASACSARVKCIPYQNGIPASNSQCTDVNVGGCTTCSNSNYPSCVTLINTLENQYVMYCDVSAISSETAWLNPNKLDASTPSRTTSSSSGSSSTFSSSATHPSTTTSSNGAVPSSIGANESSVANAGNNSSSNTKTIAGSTVGGVAAIAFVIAALAWWMRRKRQRREERISIVAPAPLDPYDGPDGHPRATSGASLLPGFHQFRQGDKYHPNGIDIGNDIVSNDEKTPLAGAPESTDGMGMLRIGTPSSNNNIICSPHTAGTVSNVPTVSTIRVDSVGSGFQNPRTPELKRLAEMPTPEGGSVPLGSGGVSRGPAVASSYEMAANEVPPATAVATHSMGPNRHFPSAANNATGSAPRHPSILLTGSPAREDGNVAGHFAATPARNSQATTILSSPWSSSSSPPPQQQQQVSPMTNFTTPGSEWSRAQFNPGSPGLGREQSLMSTQYQESLGSGQEQPGGNYSGSGGGDGSPNARGGGIRYVTPEQAQSWRWTSSAGNWVSGDDGTPGAGVDGAADNSDRVK